MRLVRMLPRPAWRPRWSRRFKLLLFLELAGLASIVGVLVSREAGGRQADSFVYVEANSARRGSNSVLAYRLEGDRLAFVGAFPTRGTGTIDLGVTGSIDAQGQIAVDVPRRLLFAVNQGSDTIAAFHIRPGGRLSAVAGSPFPARGASPAGLAADGNLLLVADKAHDPARRLDGVAPVYAALRIGPGGRLFPAGKPFTAPPGSSPTQVLALGAGLVVSTEETGPFRVLELAADGTLTQTRFSPVPPAASIFPDGYDGARWAIGLAAAPHRRVLYADQSATAQLLVYRYDRGGRLSLERAVANEGAKLPCWTVVSPDGRRLFTANAGNGTVSAFDLRMPERPRQLETVLLRDAANPWGIALDRSGRTLLVVDSRAVAGLPAGIGDRLHALRVHPDGRISELSVARLPVGEDASPLGLAVVAAADVRTQN